MSPAALRPFGQLRCRPAWPAPAPEAFYLLSSCCLPPEVRNPAVSGPAGGGAKGLVRTMPPQVSAVPSAPPQAGQSRVPLYRDTKDTSLPPTER